MSKFVSKKFYREASLVCLLGLGYVIAANALRGGVDARMLFKPPTYEISLNLNEYTVFNAAEVDGLLKYGGSGDFQLRMAKEGNEVIWNITIKNPRQMEVLRIYLGEEAIKLIPNTDPSNFDAKNRLMLGAVKSLGTKLDYAQKNPIWDSLTLSGTVTPAGSNWVLQGNEARFNLVGNKLPELKSRIGKHVVADGFMKLPGQFEVTRYIDQKTNTLELFVMSFCPFGQRAETMLYDFLGRTNISARPKLDIHYIFYKQNKDGNDVFVSMHGDEEVTEDLVQIMIRDNFPPAIFEAYIRLRNESGSTDWHKLAGQVGLSKDNIATIDTTITNARETLIRQEYDYVAAQCDIKDGSPSYIWESEKVADISKVPIFKGIDSPKESCAN